MYEFLHTFPWIVVGWVLGDVVRAVPRWWDALIDWAQQDTRPHSLQRFTHEATCLFLLFTMLLYRPRQVIWAVRNHWHHKC